MNFLLDTDTLSARVRRPGGLQARFVQYSGRLFVSTIGLAELYVLAYRLDDPSPRLAKIEEILRDDVELIGFHTDSALTFGQIRADLLRRGAVVPLIDLLIASVAITHDMTLVTHNTSDLQPVPGLLLVDWLE